MRILALSDIFWADTNLRSLTGLIEGARPDLVLLAGDLVNDIFGYEDGKIVDREYYWKHARELLCFLDEREVRTFAIRGNWDGDMQGRPRP